MKWMHIEPPQQRYFVGLDLGQVNDFTAIAVLEATTTWNQDGAGDTTYAVRHLERLPLGTSYPAVVRRVEKLFAVPQLMDGYLVLDATGVGRAITDSLKDAAIQATRIVPVTITAGTTATPDGHGGWHVPKKDLVAVMQLLLQGRRLQIASALPEAAILKKELQNFQVKITLAANETFGAWREGQHDDLVLAVACAAWYAERTPLEVWDPEDVVIGRRPQRWWE